MKKVMNFWVKRTLEISKIYKADHAVVPTLKRYINGYDYKMVLGEKRMMMNFF